MVIPICYAVLLPSTWLRPGRGITPYYSLYGEAPPERGTVFSLQVYKGAGISQAEVYERVVVLKGP